MELQTHFDLDSRTCRLVEPDGSLVAIVNPDGTQSGMSDDDIVSIAHVMKAAPELLEACLRMMNELDLPDKSALDSALVSAIEFCSDAIAKAKGE